jgi:hypothetical protein
MWRTCGTATGRRYTRILSTRCHLPHGITVLGRTSTLRVVCMMFMHHQHWKTWHITYYHFDISTDDIGASPDAIGHAADIWPPEEPKFEALAASSNFLLLELETTSPNKKPRQTFRINRTIPNPQSMAQHRPSIFRILVAIMRKYHDVFSDDSDTSTDHEFWSPCTWRVWTSPGRSVTSSILLEIAPAGFCNTSEQTACLRRLRTPKTFFGSP